MYPNKTFLKQKYKGPTCKILYWQKFCRNFDYRGTLTKQPMKEDLKRYVDQITQLNVIALLHICHLKNLNQDQIKLSVSENKKIALHCRIACRKP